MYKKRIAEKRHKEKVETSAALQGAMVQTWEYDEDDCVFTFGEAVIAAFQRPETHIGYALDVTARGKAPPLYSMDGSSNEQRGCKKVHWEKRDSAREVKRICSTMVEVAKQFPNTAEAAKTSKESVSIEQGQPLRAAEPDQCALKVRTKPIPETPTERHP